jgi:hypothetical protein
VPSGQAQSGSSRDSSDAANDLSGRNDCDTKYHCVVDFSLSSTTTVVGRSATAQATPGCQLNRVVFIAGPYRNAWLVSRPTRIATRPNDGFILHMLITSASGL